MKMTRESRTLRWTDYRASRSTGRTPDVRTLGVTSTISQTPNPRVRAGVYDQQNPDPERWEAPLDA